LLIFAFRPLPAIALAQASQAGLSGKQKIKQVLSVLSVSALKMNIKTAPFQGVHRVTRYSGGI
jgi:hypothetical protein